VPELAWSGSKLRFCYEPRPCGYDILRQLSEAGHEWVVETPSLIPFKPGDRIRTDRRDAIGLESCTERANSHRRECRTRSGGDLRFGARAAGRGARDENPGFMGLRDTGTYGRKSGFIPSFG
jgi:hypothetical protein